MVNIGSTRPGRHCEAVAKWVYEIASQRSDAKFELIDLADRSLPHLDEPMPPTLGRYGHDHAKRWTTTIAAFDGFVFVTPEYNHRMRRDDFVVSVSRDFVRTGNTQLMVLPGSDRHRPAATGREIAASAPAGRTLEPWNDSYEHADHAAAAVRSFLQAHSPRQTT